MTRREDLTDDEPHKTDWYPGITEKHFDLAVSKAVRAALESQAGKLTDDARLEWLMHKISGAELRRLGIITSAGCTRECIDGAIEAKTHE
jgi:hypothetical protein